MNYDEIFIDVESLPTPLPEEQVYQLIQEAHNGSKESKDKLIIHNIRLVLYTVMNQFKTVNYDKKDLVSIGNIGLIKSINTFDISKNNRFATYASKCISNEILLFLKKLKKDQRIDSLDHSIASDKNGNELTLENILSDDRNAIEDFIEDYAKNEDYVVIKELVKSLSDRDREIISLYFGLDGTIFNQSQIAQKLHINQASVSRIIPKTLEKLRMQFEIVQIVKSYKKAAESKEQNEKRMRLQSSLDQTTKTKDKMVEEPQSTTVTSLTSMENGGIKTNGETTSSEVLLKSKIFEKEDKTIPTINFDILKTSILRDIVKDLSQEEALIVGYLVESYFTSEVGTDILKLDQDEIKKITTKLLVTCSNDLQALSMSMERPKTFEKMNLKK